jgi:hypothetical protein
MEEQGIADVNTDKGKINRLEDMPENRISQLFHRYTRKGIICQGRATERWRSFHRHNYNRSSVESVVMIMTILVPPSQMESGLL